MKWLPANILKLDKSFVRGLGENAQDTAIVRMVIDLAHTLGMEVIAEGVECEDQVLQRRKMGCDMAQGFFFARPLPSEAPSRLLAEGPFPRPTAPPQAPPAGFSPIRRHACGPREHRRRK